MSAITRTLGIQFGLVYDPEKFREEHARAKAKHLVALVQGTSGLEGQAVDAQTCSRMVNQTVHELLASKGRKLWSD